MAKKAQYSSETNSDDVKPKKSAESLKSLDKGETKKAKKTGKPSKFQCRICFESKPMSDRFENGKCRHRFCASCVSTHVATIMQQNILKVTCPNPRCSVELKPEVLHTILPDEVIVRWECAKFESSIVGSEKTYCPFKDCSVLLVNDGEEVVTSSECPSCHRLFCAQCKVPWHGDKTCEEFQSEEGNEKEKEDKKFFKLAKNKKWQKCPECAMFVQRRGGCEHIACRCGCNFCYHCGEIWSSGHLCRGSMQELILT